jgi:hypothetical protein
MDEEEEEEEEEEPLVIGNDIASRELFVFSISHESASWIAAATILCDEGTSSRGPESGRISILLLCVLLLSTFEDDVELRVVVVVVVVVVVDDDDDDDAALNNDKVAWVVSDNEFPPRDVTSDT